MDTILTIPDYPRQALLFTLFVFKNYRWVRKSSENIKKYIYLYCEFEVYHKAQLFYHNVL